MTFGEQGCGLSMEAFTTRIFSCLGNRRLASGAVITLAKGVDQLALGMQAVTASGASEVGYIALSEAVEEVLVLRQEVQHFMELSMRMLRVYRRAGPSTLI